MSRVMDDRQRHWSQQKLDQRGQVSIDKPFQYFERSDSSESVRFS
jgi:hypothetical protein